MNKKAIIPVALALYLCTQASFGAEGDFFNVSLNGTTLNISTTHGNYPLAGIKAHAGEKLFCPGKTTGQGYCLFPVGKGSPNNIIGIQGARGTATFILSVNGEGPVSPAKYGPISFTPQRGINYDPAHSQAYVNAQSSNNQAGMIASMRQDFTQMKNNNYTVVKTFISAASTFSGVLSNLADIACPMGFKLMLGVYEFTPSDGCSNNAQCITWTAPQVSNAISSVQKYPNCIIGIAVGNEDIYNGDFTVPNTEIQQRISNDITTIKNAIGNATIVGTAQQDGAFLKLAGNDPYGIIPKLDFVGANIYPYWSGTAESNAAGEFTARLNAIKAAYPQKHVIVTEEGWPSQSNSPPQAPTSIQQEVSYYQYWLGRAATDDVDSYYFAFYDKLNVAPNVGDANNFFGLCTSGGSIKNAGLISCQS